MRDINEWIKKHVYITCAIVIVSSLFFSKLYFAVKNRPLAPAQKENTTKTQTITQVQEAVMIPTVIPKVTQTPEEIFTYIAHKEIGDDSDAYALEQDDGYWVVTVIINRWPPIFSDLGVQDWGYRLMREIYHSNQLVKQVGLTVNGPEGKYYRAFLGINQANLLSEYEWQNHSPGTFNSWMKAVSTGRNEPDRSNRTFIEEKF